MALQQKKGGDPSHRRGGYVAELLQGCCLGKESAILLWPEMMALSKATFHAVEGDQVVFLNPSMIRRSFLDPTLPISVTFSHLGQVFTFITWYVSYTEARRGGDEEERGGARLVVKLPTRLASSDTRASSRVPVLPDFGLRLKGFFQGHEGEESFTGAVKEISLTGINLDCSAEEDPNLPEGTAFRVFLKLGGQEEDTAPDLPLVKMEASVRRRQGRRYEITFPDCFSSEGLSPPEELRRLYKTLERTYLQRRAEQQSERDEEP